MKRIMLLFVASMLFSGMMFAQEYHWADFDFHDYTRPMIVISRVQFNGEFQNRADIEVAAFVGDELRGRSFLFEPYPGTPIDGQYYAYAPCYYNTPGETFTFKAFDHAANLEYDVCSTTLVGQDDGHGTVEDPIILDFSRTVEPSYGPEYPWVPSTAYNGEGMVVTAQIMIDGVLVDRGSYEVGVFCGEECRATSGVEGLDDWTDIDMGYFAFMNVMGNNGDIINFYLHDLENNCNFAGICSTVIELENGGELGVDIFGGGIFVLNFESIQTFTKDIIGYGTGTGNWYMIASPIDGIDPFDVTNMIAYPEEDYDLFSFQQVDGEEWLNYKVDLFNLEAGKGYLYANKEDVTLTFTGLPYNGDGEVVLEKVDDAIWSGWNLVGNPFTETAYIGDRDFYIMNFGGTEIIKSTSPSIEPMEGVFVIAENDGEMLTFSTVPPAKSAMLSLNLSQGRNVVDCAAVRFGVGRSLPKLQLNPNSTKVYIPMDNVDYAVVLSEGAGELPVNFKAESNGTYTLSFTAEEVSFNYLHLVDNMTGADVDLLVPEPVEGPASYTFTAKTTDYPSRFKLVFATGNNSDDNFAFFSNGSFVISNEGEATLQVVDVNGRILKNETINGSASVHINAAPGVYMLRLINGDNVKVQKVVVD